MTVKIDLILIPLMNLEQMASLPIRPKKVISNQTAMMSMVPMSPHQLKVTKKSLSRIQVLRNRQLKKKAKNRKLKAAMILHLKKQPRMQVRITSRTIQRPMILRPHQLICHKQMRFRL
jgi:hypothetical protein